MLRNYIITAIRSFRTNLGHNLINIFGLGLGLACTFAVYAIVRFEYSFDHFHKKADSIHRITRVVSSDIEYYQGTVPYPIGQMINDQVSGVQSLVEMHGPVEGEIAIEDSQVGFRVFEIEKILSTTSSFFEMLDFEILEGSPELFDEPYQVFLTATTAEKFFGSESPIGRKIAMDSEIDLQVAGIIKDIPNNTNLPFEMLVSLETLKKTQPRIWKNWGMTWAYCLYMIPEEGVEVEAILSQMDQLFEKHNEDERGTYAFLSQPLKQIHTDEKYGNGYHYVTPKLMIYAFLFLGFLVLGTACLNFINLNTSIAVKRSKEIGVRKTLGSTRAQLVYQFLFETLVIVSLAMLVGLAFGQVLIDSLNQLLSLINYDLSFDSSVIAFCILSVAVVTILSGSYPALILANFQPAAAIRNAISLNKGSGNFNLRRLLIVLQFAFTAILIVSSIFIYAQVDFMKYRDAGFSDEGVYTLQLPQTSDQKRENFFEELKRFTEVKEATLSFNPPLAGFGWNNIFEVDGKEESLDQNANLKFIESNYLNFYDIELLAGANIENRVINDSTYDILVNEYLVQVAGWENNEKALGKKLTLNNNTMTVKGVVNDFNVYAQGEVKPVILYHRPGMLTQAAMRFNTVKNQTLEAKIENKFREHFPDAFFSIESLEESIASEFLVEDLLSKVVRFIAVLSILLSGMGLYGLVSFMATKSAKVIGIRKVFGASIPSILSFFMREYIMLVSLAFLLSVPVSYYLLTVWIQDFTYRLDIEWLYFTQGFAIVLVIALVTVGYRSWLAAKANPISSLQQE